jgi:hypothetical protein
MKLNLSLALICLLKILNAQPFSEPCATMPVYYNHLQNASVKQNYALAEQNARKWLQNNASQFLKTQNAVIKIPVVVHVVYKNAAQNVPDSMIFSQISVLNECFRKQNSNYNTTRPVFDSLGADIEIEFCLANTDPQGNPTTGIIRKAAPSNAQFDPLFGFDNSKKPSKGGDTAWATSSYFNIWLADMSLFNQTIVLGYATFPGSDPALDGVVIQYNYFGKYSKPNFFGRTTVHETGHWLGMRHIWADDDNGQNPQTVYCDSTDFVDDTPNAGPKSSTNCDKTKNTCSLEAVYWGATDAPDMVENYMDYSSDACMTLFTKGQKARMYSFLNSDPNRMAIKTSTAGCNTVMSVKTIQNFADYISLSPNPANSMLNIKINGFGESDFSLIMFDVNGKIILSQTVNYSSSSLPLQNLANGLYFLKIANNYNSCVKKVLVQH